MAAGCACNPGLLGISLFREWSSKSCQSNWRLIRVRQPVPTPGCGIDYEGESGIVSENYWLMWTTLAGGNPLKGVEEATL